MIGRIQHHELVGRCCSWLELPAQLCLAFGAAFGYHFRNARSQVELLHFGDEEPEIEFGIP